MSNLISDLRDSLNENNYVRKADPQNRYFFDFSKSVMDRYIDKLGEQFNLVIYGSENINDDFYVLPFGAFRHIFNENNLADSKKGRRRWVGTIMFNELRVTHDRIRPDISAYRGNLDLLGLGRTEIETSSTLSEDDRNDYAIENRKTEIKARQKQSLFRKRVLANFDNACCLTGIREDDLLVASHIVPWSHRKESRLDPGNGLCLFVVYDSLFDQGYFCCSDDLRVIITPKVDNLSSHLAKTLYEIKDRKITPPKNYAIKQEYIRYHRENVFKG